MKKMLFAALLAGAAVPAHATYIRIDATFDLTYMETRPGQPPSIIDHQGLQTIHFEGDLAGKLDGQIRLYTSVPCSKCAQYTVTGNQLSIIISGNVIPYGTSTATLVFDQDLGGDILNAKSAKLVSGSYYTYWSHGSFSSSSGPAVSVVFDVPEPASWAMMMGGLALVGGAMRRRPPLRAARATFSCYANNSA